ncbi:ribbon-helix-helix protein, CopG family [Halococcus sp. AFM35]|uniref:ribbon-helix-helix protein, CopG family n=1 Tax=Halococcus sp. AFM35 TaxID=3421653 RepID=UPI003EBA365A
MPRLTITVTDKQAALLEELSGDGGQYESKSAAVRDFIQTGERVAELEQEVERLNRERRQLLEQREERGELVRYVEDQREQEQNARERRKKPAWTRAWWWLTGEPE